MSFKVFAHVSSYVFLTFFHLLQYSDSSGSLPSGFPVEAFSFTAGSGDTNLKCSGNENNGIGKECVWYVIECVPYPKMDKEL